MTTQPEALRLADDLESTTRGYPPVMMASAELRRLHAVNQELLEALKAVLRWIDDYCETTGFDAVEAQADAAIAKAEGQQ